MSSAVQLALAQEIENFDFVNSNAFDSTSTEEICEKEWCSDFKLKYDCQQRKCIQVPQCKKQCTKEDYVLHPHEKCKCVPSAWIDELEIEWEMSKPLDLEEMGEPTEGECTKEESCNPFTHFNWNKCSCEPNEYCKDECPENQVLHPDYNCKCMDKAVVQKRMAGWEAEVSKDPS